jgi:hypothetical protein
MLSLILEIRSDSMFTFIPFWSTRIGQKMACFANDSEDTFLPPISIDPQPHKGPNSHSTPVVSSK